jgi:alpha-beta hydrolase superfamily lysophospholipase
LKFIPVELRQKLPLFTLEDKLPIDPLVQQYRRFYHIDFETRFNDLNVYMGKVRVSGFDVVVHGFVPKAAKGTVFIVHGYYDHVGIYNHLIKALLKQRYAVMAFDLPGHGLSSGSRAAISSFRQYLPVLKRVIQLADGNAPKPWHAVAQSTGGAIVSEYLLQFAGLEQRIPFDGVVFYAPLIRPVHWFWNSRLHTLISPFRNFVTRKFSENSNNPQFAEFIRDKDPLQPRLLSSKWVGALKQWMPYIERHAAVHFPLYIVQGKSDQTVDWQHNIPIFQRVFTGTEVTFMPNVRHHVVNELELYRKDVFARTIKYLDGFSVQRQQAIR